MSVEPTPDRSAAWSSLRAWAMVGVSAGAAFAATLCGFLVLTALALRQGWGGIGGADHGASGAALLVSPLALPGAMGVALLVAGAVAWGVVRHLKSEESPGDR